MRPQSDMVKISLGEVCLTASISQLIDAQSLLHAAQISDFWNTANFRVHVLPTI